MPSLFPSSSSYLICQIFACGGPVPFHLFPFYLKSWCPPRFPSRSYFIRQIFACGRPLLFSLFPFNFKSWCPSLFPSSSSYSICQIFACCGNESNSNMTTLFACAYGVTSLFPSLNMFQEHVAFQLVTVISWPLAGSSSLFSKVPDKY